MNWEVAIYKHGFLTWKRQIDSSLQQSNFTDWNPFHTYARMLRIGVDALSAAISAGSILYPYCVCGLPLWSVPIRSQILKVKSSFTYDADAADEVIPYWLRTASASLRTLSTASVLYPPTKLMCRCLPSLRREYGYSHWRQPRRGCRGHIPPIFWLGGTSTGISPPIFIPYFWI